MQHQTMSRARSTYPSAPVKRGPAAPGVEPKPRPITELNNTRLLSPLMFDILAGPADNSTPSSHPSPEMP